MSGFCQISSLASLFQVVKNVNFEPNFQHESEFLYFDKFHPSKIQSGKKSHIWAKFSTQIKFYGFCQISFFVGLLVKM